MTANTAAAKAFGASEILPMWDWVGGRFSVWSAVGFAAACAIGWEGFEEFLLGANEIDRHFAETPLEKNIPALMALIGVWNTNFLGASTHAVLPYSNALRLLPAYLQQLEMESNGKRVDREGRPVDYATAPILWGAEGTVSRIPSTSSCTRARTRCRPTSSISSWTRTCPRTAARRPTPSLSAPMTRRCRRTSSTPATARPACFLLISSAPRTLGRLLALYEHKVFTQGVLWNINSFDQWGVELGKEMAKNGKKILSGGR